MKIDFAKLQDQYQLEIDEAIHAVLDKSNYIMGEEVRRIYKICYFMFFWNRFLQ